MHYTSGSISATGSSHAVSRAIEGFGPESMGIIATDATGTYGGGVLVVEKKLYGVGVWAPVTMTNEKTQVRTSGTASPTDSTVNSYRVDLAGASDVRAYFSSGTLTNVTVGIVTGAVEEFGGILPSVYTSNTSATTFGAGITFSGATTVNTISIPDNLADALNIEEGSNSYLKFTTTNSAETITVTPLLTCVAGISFTGATGTNLLKLTDNLASALDITEASNSYLKITTTNSAERVKVGKLLGMPINATPVAATGAGGGVGGAAAVSLNSVVLISSDGATKGVKLNTGVAGDVVYILNTSATAANLFAASGGTINGGAADAGCAIAASKGALCFCTAADTWTVFDFTAQAGAAA